MKGLTSTDQVHKKVQLEAQVDDEEDGVPSGLGIRRHHHIGETATTNNK